MENKVSPIAPYNPLINKYLPHPLSYDYIFQSKGLEKHIEKRHPDCLPYFQFIPYTVSSPDYVGINPNEPGVSFELVKVVDKNIQIEIKLDSKNDYLYVATLYTITDGKLQHGIKNGRLKKLTIYELSITIYHTIIMIRQ